MVNCVKLSGRMGWGPDEADKRAVIPGIEGGMGRHFWLGPEGRVK